MKCKQKKKNYRYHPYRRIPLNTQEGCSMKNLDPPTLPSSGQKVNTPKHSPENGKRLPSGNHGNSEQRKSPKVETGKSGNIKRKRSDSNQNDDEERPAKAGRFDATEHPAVKNLNQPILTSSGLKMETTKQFPEHGKRLTSSNHGNSGQGMSPKVETGKSVNLKRKISEDDSYHSNTEQQPAKKRRFNDAADHPAVEDLNQPIIPSSGINIETPKQLPKNAKRQTSSNHGNSGQAMSPNVETGKSENLKRKRSEDESNHSGNEQPPAKRGVLHNIRGWFGVIMDKILPQREEERPTSNVSSSTPAVSEKVNEEPCTSTRHEPVKFNLNSFIFHKILGQGSYGKVALASHPATDKLLAVKAVQKRRLLSEDPYYILMERKVLEMVARSSFCTHAYGTFQTEENLFFILELMRGGDLFNLIKSKGPLPTDTIRFIAAEILCALQFLHSNGIIHRDLKPQNILLDDVGHAKIADFGVSEVNVFGSRKLTVRAGTPGYMAPEVEQRKPYNTIADYYSFGAILYEMTTGKNASNIVKSGGMEIYANHIDPDLRDVIKRLLLRCPKDREEAVKRLREHRFFRPIDWKELEAGEATPPFQMPICPDIDTSKQIEPTMLDHVDRRNRKIPEAHQELFNGFSFISEKWKELMTGQ